MQYYGLFDKSGKPTGFYNTDIHGTIGSKECLIPAAAIVITEDDWQRYLTGKYHYDADTGQCVADPSPSEAQLLQAAKDAKDAEINAAREAAIDAGVEYGGHTWDSDEKSRVNLTGLLVSLQAGTKLPDGFTWRTADNNDVALTAAQFVEFGAAMLDHLNTQYQKSWALKAQVDASQTAAEIVAIEWS